MYFQSIKYINTKTKTIRHATCLLVHVGLLFVDKCNRVRICIAELNELVCAWSGVINTLKFVLPCSFFEIARCKQTVLVDVSLFCNCSSALLFRLNDRWTLTSGKVGLANLVDTHNHLIYFADIVVSAFANCCRVNFAICRFSLPVISQEIFSAKNVVIVRRKTYRTGWKKSFCEILDKKMGTEASKK